MVFYGSAAIVDVERYLPRTAAALAAVFAQLPQEA